MMYKNKFDYSQPDFYHFSEDSLFLKETAFSDFEINEVAALKIADLGAGSGIQGIEIANAFGMKNIILDLFEIQKDFLNHIDFNLKNFLKQGDSRVFIGSYFEFPFANDYDLVLCNPPYFQVGSGRLPANINSQICEFYEIGEKEKLIATIASCLRTDGVAYILQSSKHNKEQDHFEFLLRQKDNLSFCQLAENNGSLVYRISKI